MSRLRRDEGQAVVLVIFCFLGGLLCAAAMVVDVGHAYLVQRDLQSVADAAALAAAQSLPSAAAAADAATAYGPGRTGLNKLGDGTAVQQSATPWCLKGVQYCFGNKVGAPAPLQGQANGVVVKETSQVKTTFMKLFGVPTITVHATATACGTCSSPPRDIAIVVDRTLSMDLSNSMGALTNSIDTFLTTLDNTEDYVTLLEFPPAPGANACKAPSLGLPTGSGSSYSTGDDDHYLIVPLSSNYKNPDGSLNQSSQLVTDVKCMQPGGYTSYEQALVAAQNQLVNHGSGRPGVQRVIVFETDGAANTAPDSFYGSPSHDGLYPAATAHVNDINHPCGSAVDYANNTIKPSGTVIYTIGYKLVSDDNCYVAPHYTRHNSSYTETDWEHTHEANANGQDTLDAATALSEMADPNPVLQAGDSGSLDSSFSTIASDILKATLVPDSAAQ